jgi:hypothetical protein
MPRGAPKKLELRNMLNIKDFSEKLRSEKVWKSIFKTTLSPTSVPPPFPQQYIARHGPLFTIARVINSWGSCHAIIFPDNCEFMFVMLLCMCAHLASTKVCFTPTAGQKTKQVNSHTMESFQTCTCSVPSGEKWTGNSHINSKNKLTLTSGFPILIVYLKFEEGDLQNIVWNDF